MSTAAGEKIDDSEVFGPQKSKQQQIDWVTVLNREKTTGVGWKLFMCLSPWVELFPLHLLEPLLM